MLLVGAVAIKASALILFPILLAGSSRRLRLMAGILIGGVGLGLASYAAFGATLPDLAQQAKLVIPTGIPNLVGYLLGLGGETDTLRTICAAVLVLTVLGVHRLGLAHARLGDAVRCRLARAADHAELGPALVPPVAVAIRRARVREAASASPQSCSGSTCSLVDATRRPRSTVTSAFTPTRLSSGAATRATCTCC